MRPTTMPAFAISIALAGMVYTAAAADPSSTGKMSVVQCAPRNDPFDCVTEAMQHIPTSVDDGVAVKTYGREEPIDIMWTSPAPHAAPGIVHITITDADGQLWAQHIATANAGGCASLPCAPASLAVAAAQSDSVVEAGVASQCVPCHSSWPVPAWVSDGPYKLTWYFVGGSLDGNALISPAMHQSNIAVSGGADLASMPALPSARTSIRGPLNAVQLAVLSLPSQQHPFIPTDHMMDLISGSDTRELPPQYTAAGAVFDALARSNSEARTCGPCWPSTFGPCQAVNGACWPSLGDGTCPHSMLKCAIPVEDGPARRAQAGHDADLHSHLRQAQDSSEPADDAGATSSPEVWGYYSAAFSGSTAGIPALLPVSSIPWDKLTHLVYRSAALTLPHASTTTDTAAKQPPTVDPLWEPTDSLDGSGTWPVAAAAVAAARDADVAVILAIGGPAMSLTMWRDSTRTETMTKATAAAIVKAAVAHGFSGILLAPQWLGTRAGSVSTSSCAADAHVLDTLVPALAAAAAPYKLSLHVELPVSVPALGAAYHISDWEKHIESFIVMGSDVYAADSHPITGCASPLRAEVGSGPATAQTDIAAVALHLQYIEQVPPSKLVMAMPAHAQTWLLGQHTDESGQPATLTQLLRPGYTSIAPGSAGAVTKQSGYATSYEVLALAESMPGKDTAAGFFESTGCAAWTNGVLWASYESELSVAYKARWIQAANFRGGALTDLHADDGASGQLISNAASSSGGSSSSSSSASSGTSASTESTSGGTSTGSSSGSTDGGRGSGFGSTDDERGTSGSSPSSDDGSSNTADDGRGSSSSADDRSSSSSTDDASGSGGANSQNNNMRGGRRTSQGSTLLTVLYDTLKNSRAGTQHIVLTLHRASTGTANAPTPPSDVRRARRQLGSAAYPLSAVQACNYDGPVVLPAATVPARCFSSSLLHGVLNQFLPDGISLLTMRLVPLHNTNNKWSVAYPDTAGTKLTRAQQQDVLPCPEGLRVHLRLVVDRGASISAAALTAAEKHVIAYLQASAAAGASISLDAWDLSDTQNLPLLFLPEAPESNMVAMMAAAAARTLQGSSNGSNGLKGYLLTGTAASESSTSSGAWVETGAASEQSAADYAAAEQQSSAGPEKDDESWWTWQHIGIVAGCGVAVTLVAALAAVVVVKRRRARRAGSEPNTWRRFHSDEMARAFPQHHLAASGSGAKSHWRNY